MNYFLFDIVEKIVFLCIEFNFYKQFKKMYNMSTEIKKSDSVDVSRFLQLHGITNLNQNEQALFIDTCKLHNLNPFKREIYIVKYDSEASIIVGYETYIKRAELSGRLDGWSTEIEPCTSVIVDINGNMSTIKDFKATVTIHRKDFSKPFTHSVKMSAYLKKTKSGNVTKFWQKDPEGMLKKVAISQGFRLCFNEILGGLPYTREEMSLTEDVTYTDVTESRKEVVEETVFDYEVIKNCDNINSLQQIFKSNESLHKNNEFVRAVAKQKETIIQSLFEEAVSNLIDITTLEQLEEIQKDYSDLKKYQKWITALEEQKEAITNAKN